MSEHHHIFTQSSMITACSYDDESKELTVKFINSKEYVYEDVDKIIYDTMTDPNQSSVGRYFNSIKAGLKVKQ